MASAAMLGAIAARRNAKKKKIDSHKFQPDVKLTDVQARRVKAQLRSESATAFLSFLVEGKNHDYVEPTDDEIAATASAAAAAALIEPVESTDFPESKPNYLSLSHFKYMRAHKKATRSWNPLWLKAYAKGDDSATATMVSLKSQKPVENDDLEAIVGGIEKTSKLSEAPLESSRIMRFNEWVLLNQVIVASAWFNNLVVFCIILAGVLVGVQTYPSMEGNLLLDKLDLAVQCVFTADCCFKIFMEGVNPLNYWLGPDASWNNFDFWLVAVCWVPPAYTGGNVAFLRLLRLMRLLKLVSKVKQLQVIVQGLLQGLGSVTYILLLLLLIFYLFAVLGVGTFRKNDPFHFGSLGRAMLTCFFCATLEGWSSILSLETFGCNSQNVDAVGFYFGDGGVGTTPFYPGELAKKPDRVLTEYGDFPARDCWHPKRQPVIAIVYFVAFVLIAAFVVLSLFIGAVCGGMNDALETFKAQEQAEVEAANNLDPNDPLLVSLKDFFDSIDEDGSGTIDARETATALNLIDEKGNGKVTEEEALRMIHALHHSDDDRNTVSFKDFVSLMTNNAVDINGYDEAMRVADAKKDEDELAEQAERRAAKRAQAEEDRVDIAKQLSLAWGFDLDDLKLEHEWNQRPIYGGIMRFSRAAKELGVYSPFVNLMTLVICCAGVNVGIQTELSHPGNVYTFPVLDLIDTIILAFFTLELAVTFTSLNFHPWEFFYDPWNCFDLFIVGACYIFMLPFMPNLSSLLSMLRLLRLLRVLKLVKALPQLRIIIEALISGFGSITFVTVILFIFFYLYANIGMMFFQRNDPAHWCNLQTALTTLFRLATLDGYSDLVYVNIYGCDYWWVYSNGRPQYGFESKIIHKRDHSNCNHPHAWGWLAVAYFISFVVLGSQVLMTLFVGIVATAMEEKKEIQKAEDIRDKRLTMRQTQTGVPEGKTFVYYRRIFELLDKQGDFDLTKEVMKQIVEALPAVVKNKHLWEAFEEGEVTLDNLDDFKTDDERVKRECVRRLDLDKLFQILALWDDHFAGAQYQFPEFFVVLEIVRRCIFDPRIIVFLRQSYKIAKEPPQKDQNAPKDPPGTMDEKFSAALKGIKKVDHESNYRARLSRASVKSSQHEQQATTAMGIFSSINFFPSISPTLSKPDNHPLNRGDGSYNGTTI